ncbi:MAG TPA: TldD/PmbA family protein [Actinomycetota bacterium]
MSDLDALCRAALDAAAGDEHLEAYAEWGRKTDVKVYDGRVESLTSAEARGLGVRIIDGGRVGYAYAADPDPDEVRAVVEQARANAVLGSADDGNVLPEPEPIEPLDGIYLPQIAATSTDAKVALALELERLTRAADPRVTGVEEAQYGDSISRVAIRSTRGVAAEVERGDCWAVVSALANQGDETQTGFSFELARAPEHLNLARCGTEAATRASRMLGARKPATEKMPVLLDPYAAASFLGVLAAGLTAEAVLKGRSLFAGKEGAAVAAGVFTLVDDGRELKGPGASPFDDEGVPTRRTPLIEAGVLRGFLHNTYTARRMGGHSTGNAGRAGFKSTPGVGPSNLFVAPGSLDQAGLLGKAGRALLVQDLIGVHSGANPISGDFSVGVTGLVHDGGADPMPIREAAIAGTILQILGAITDVGSDLRFFGSTGSPTLLIGEMTVAGS